MLTVFARLSAKHTMTIAAVVLFDKVFVTRSAILARFTATFKFYTYAQKRVIIYFGYNTVKL